MVQLWMISVVSAILFWSLQLAALAEKPDIVILLTDQQRYDELGVAGTPGVKTPTMDRLCRKGVWFTHAHATTPQCSPTRAALWTGLYPHRNGVMGNVGGSQRVPAGMSAPLSSDIPSLGQLFSDAGYETAYFGKWHLGVTPAAHGFVTHFGGRGGDRRATQATLDFLQKRQPQTQRRPLLLVVSWLNPHDIYHINRPDTEVEGEQQARAPESLGDDLLTKPFPQRHFLAEDQGKPFANYSRRQWKRYVAFYHQLTTIVDAEMGLVLAEVRRLSPNALVVFTAEHGDMGGAHRLPYKCPAMYDELVRVPLAVSWPGKFAPAKRNELVDSIDLLPTLCDLAGVPAPPGIDGRSMRPLLEGQTAQQAQWRKTIVGEYYGKQNWRVPIRMIRSHQWKYVRYLHWGEELYDLRADPHEMTNLADSSQHAQMKQNLSQQLDRWIKRTDDPFPQLSVTDRDGLVLPKK